MSTFSHWDLPLLADPGRYSNFHSFVESIVPVICSKRLVSNLSDSTYQKCEGIISMFSYVSPSVILQRYHSKELNKKFPFTNCVEKEYTGAFIRKLKQEKDGDKGSKIAVPPFALATYKMNGDFWMNPATSDQEKMSSYLDASSSWLKLVNFQHNDFDFFMSRRRF